MIVRSFVMALGAACLIAAGCSSSSPEQGPTTSSATAGSGGNVGDSGGSGGHTSGGAGGGICYLPPHCDNAPPHPGAQQDWKHVGSKVLANGDVRHRGRDTFFKPGDPQWLIAKFAYGKLQGAALKDENVDIHLLRGCTGEWELLGSVATTEKNQHPAVDGVEDDGGRVFFQIPQDKVLDVGRHRVHFVVRGDLSTVELFVEVLSAGTFVFVSDVDGTLTTFDVTDFEALLEGSLPEANPGAASAFATLVGKGWRPFYLTARPEWLTERTRGFLAAAGFEGGIVRTTAGNAAVTGNAVTEHKTQELALLAKRGLVPSYGFGNSQSDGDAYLEANIQPAERRVFYQFDDAKGGRRIESYDELSTELEALPSCP